MVGSGTEHYIAPEQAIGTTYWNRRMVNGPMISLEDGVLLRPDVALHRPNRSGWPAAPPSPRIITA